MMQAAESRHGIDLATCIVMNLGFTTCRSSLLQSKMSSVLVIITNVITHQSFQMPLIEHDGMVEQIPAAVADPALRDTVLPRTSEAGPLGLDAEALHGLNHILMELCAAIKDQILGSRVIRERFAQLLRDPRAGWMSGYVAAQYPPPVMRDDEEAIQHTKGQRRHGEEVHRSDGLTMIIH